MRNTQNSIHSKFILTPIIGILQDAANACAGIGNGVETQPLSEYVLQTTFLKLTGASEQKLKCICWEIATNDLDYRYRYLKKNYGECSSYGDKSSIYKDIIERISKIENSFTIAKMFDDVDISAKEKELIEKKIKEAQINQERKKNRKLTDGEVEKLTKGMTAYLNKNGLCEKERTKFSRIVLAENIQEEIDSVIGHSLVAIWQQQNYNSYKTLWQGIKKYTFAEGDTLLGKELQELYTDYVYAQRNRCAHNLVSYQNNLPTLKSLIDENYKYNNYYLHFSVLVLLDEIFVRLYKAYQNSLTGMIAAI